MIRVHRDKILRLLAMADKVKEPELLKIGFGVWISFCLVLCLWFFKTFTTGRSRLQTNLHVIEDGLKKMQDSIELRQRQKSIGFTDDMEDISEFMDKFNQAKYDEPESSETGLSEENNDVTIDDDTQDKKNI